MTGLGDLDDDEVLDPADEAAARAWLDELEAAPERPHARIDSGGLNASRSGSWHRSRLARAEADAASPWASPWERGPRASPLVEATGAIVAEFSEGATTIDEYEGLARFAEALDEQRPLPQIDTQLRALSHEGYLRGAIVLVADALGQTPRLDLALRLASELLDALAPELGVALGRAILAAAAFAGAREPATRAGRFELEVSTNLMLAEHLLELGELGESMRHFEAVLAIDVDHARALRGWSTCARELERRGLSTEHRSRGLSLLDGLEELELAGGVGLDRYELGRPLGRGRHAVVYEAYDRRVGRSVALKRLLGDEARRTRAEGVSARVVEARFFAEAETLARVRSPHVVALLDVQPRHRFVALELCRGGNLRLAMRRRLLTPRHLDAVGEQLRLALAAVHAAGAVHRDIKPANILVRESRAGSPIALADFGLAIGEGAPAPAPKGARRSQAGTLRYLAPELKAGGRASPASDLFGAGVVLLELAIAPAPLPRDFDRLDPNFDPRPLAAELLTKAGTDAAWAERLAALLAPDPAARTW
ncbi:putative eukaryotic-type serine/threonine protein kinase [Plesiocystis pacifica SIR-1]|uniref:Putative eukaryotic-type serine/threonine protein kinase n=1 Tax=Plesiocystis pacifica SIR-1 TaxID=391625 RepID=A6G9D7_9BACT|nr:protein kinase [Plesiocystis pacifica]EDM77559.1 putative eukaryotic-type serine/threonine protein kinase [Plesiocystis pacifica SIR-1]